MNGCTSLVALLRRCPLPLLVLPGLLLLLPSVGPSADWPQAGYDPERTNFNPNEYLLGPSNVGDLQILWRIPTPCSIRGQVSVVDGIAYYGHYCGEARAVDTATGQTIWSQSFPGKHQGQSVVDGVAYVSSTNNSGSAWGTLYAFDALTGATIWTWHLASRRFGGPLVSDGVLYIVSTGGDSPVLHALDVATGTESWTLSPGGSVAVHEGLIYMIAAQTLEAHDATTRDLLWIAETDGSALAGPAVADGIVYVHSALGQLYAFDASRSGEPVRSPLWFGVTQPQGGDGPQGPAVADGKVYVGAANTLYAFRAGGCAVSPCSPVWTTTTSCPFFTHRPAVANRVVYSTCGYNYIYAFGAGTGNVLWSYYTPGGYPMRSSPTIVDGRVFHCATFDFELYVFESSTPVPILLSGFTAVPQDRLVLLSWHTSFGDMHDGFNAYRSRTLHDGYEKLNEGLIREHEYLDRAVDPSTTYYYRLGDVRRDGEETLHPPTTVTTPAWRFQTGLGVVSPSPFRESTTIGFSLAGASGAWLAVHDVSGRLVRVLIQEELPRGDHEARWDGCDEAGARVAGGAYFVRLAAGDVTQTRKVVFLGRK